MISSAAYSSHPFFRFKSEEFAPSSSISETKTVSQVKPQKSVNSSIKPPQKLTGRWVLTGKSYPKMELEWTVVEPHQDNMNIHD